MIETAAIAINGQVYSLPRPKRHHDIINYLAEIVRLPIPIGGKQGFIDSELGFVGRTQAGDIARASGQTDKLKRVYPLDVRWCFRAESGVWQNQNPASVGSLPESFWKRPFLIGRQLCQC